MSAIVGFGFYGYDFLLVINFTQSHILHHFQDIAFDVSNITIFGYPLRLNPDGGVPLG